MIAEDDPSTRLVLREVLARKDYHVVAVENGRLACEAARREHPDVIVLDWLMPVMDGRAALEELKADDETRGIPIVMLSSDAQVEKRIIALESGVQDFLSKPFDARELIACIEQQLRWRRGLAVEADQAFVAERDALAAASERRYRTLAEAMPHIVWIADAEGTISFFNQNWYAYAGMSSRAPAGAWLDAIHIDDRHRVTRAWSSALSSGSPFEVQCRLRRASDDTYRWHLVRAIPTSDEHGKVFEWVGSCTDINDYKIATETRTILDTMGSIVAIRSDDGVVEYSSPYWSQYTGAASDSALGHGWRAFVHADDLDLIDRVYGAAQSSAAGARHCELRLRRHDGTYRWFLSKIEMLPGSAETPRRWLETATDVDDLKRTQAALANSEARYRALTDSMPQMVWVLRGDAVEYVNLRWVEYTGRDLDKTQRGGFGAVVHSDDVTTYRTMHAAFERDERTCEIRLQRGDGGYRWHRVRVVPFDGGPGEEPRWVGTATDIDDDKATTAALTRTAARLEQLAHHDPMTKLPNRTLLTERLGQALALAQRAKSQVLVLYLDLDRFKSINDTHGHAAGDRVLTVTSERIVDALRAGDMASRVGGDEFVLVCAANDAAEDGAKLATRLLAAIGQPIDIDGEQLCVGASIGISMYPADGSNGEDLIRKADSAMYTAKKTGRHAFRLYRPEAHNSMLAALELETELRRALTDDQIVVHYQPIWSLPAQRIVGAEALVRWEHPQRGLLEPQAFLTCAQTHRLLEPLGALVLDTVCAQIASLAGGTYAGLRFTVNVWARELTQPGWVRNLAATLERRGADPHRLQIELSERVISTADPVVHAVLAELQTLGVSIVIDDFGTGTGSLAAIKSAPLRTLKIDRSFTRNIAGDPADLAVAKSIVTLAHGLDLGVIAAGVETREQAQALEAIGSDAFQGYLGGRPMPISQLLATLYGS